MICAKLSEKLTSDIPLTIDTNRLQIKKKQPVNLAVNVHLTVSAVK